MRVIETVKASQCQRCGRPPTRCRCDTKSSIRHRSTCVANHISHFVAETEKLTGEDIRGALSLQITIKDTLQETTTHDDTLPVEYDITCPRCVWKLKQAQESEETGSIINNLCEHCHLRAQIRRLKEEKIKIVRDEQERDKFVLFKQQVYSSQIRQPSNDQEVNTLKQIKIKISDNHHKFIHSSPENNILSTESAFSHQSNTEKKSYSETNLLKLINVPCKSSTQKKIVWSTALDVAGLNKTPIFRSASTISHLDSRDVKIKVLLQSDYPKAPPDSSEVIKKDVCIQKEKEKNITHSKTENLSDEKIMLYHFPTISKQESMVKHISSSELVRETQEKLLKKHKEKKQKVQELLRMQRLESINKRHERELRKIAEETQRQKIENRNFATEEEKSELAEEKINNLVVKYSRVIGKYSTGGDETEQILAVKANAILKEQTDKEVKVKQEIYKTITKQKRDTKVKQKVSAHTEDVKDSTLKLKYQTHEPERKDADRKKKREDVKRLETQDVLKNKKEQEIRVKLKVLKGELADKKTDTYIATKKKQVEKKDEKRKREIDAIKKLKIYDGLKRKKEGDGRLKQIVTKIEVTEKIPDTNIAAKTKQEVEEIIDIKKKEKNDAQNMHITKGRNEKKQKKEDDRHEKGEIRKLVDMMIDQKVALKSQATGSVSQNGESDAFTKRIDEKRKEEKLAKTMNLKFEKEAQTMTFKLEGETKKGNKHTLDKQPSSEASRKKQDADEKVNIVKTEVKVDQKKKKDEGETKKTQEEAYLKKKQEGDSRAKETKLKHEKDMEMLTSKSKGDKKKQIVEDRIWDQEQIPMPEKQATDDAPKKKHEEDRAAENKSEEEKANEKRKKENEVKRKLDADMLKKQQIADEAIKEVKRKADKEMQTMISTLRGETEKQKEEDSIRAQEQQVTLGKQSTDKEVRKQQIADESAQNKREEEHEIERKRKKEEETRKNKEKVDTLKKKHEEDEKLKQKILERGDEMKKMIIKLKEDEKIKNENAKKQKDEERMRAQDKQAIEIKQVAEEALKKKREAVEAGKRKTEEEKAGAIKNKEVDVVKPDNDDASKKRQEEHERAEKEKLKHEMEMKKMITKLRDEKEADHKRDREQKNMEEKQAADELTRKKRDIAEIAKQKKETGVDETAKMQKDKDENRRKDKEEDKRIKEEKLKDDQNKQNEDAHLADQGQKNMIKKQSAGKEAAENAIKQKQLAEETLKNKQEEDNANETRMKEEAFTKQKLELELKKKQEEKRQHEKQLKDMILKLKEDTKKLNEEERVKDMERKTVLEKVATNDKVRQKQATDEAATAEKKLEEEKAEKKKLAEEVANKKKKQEEAKKELELEQKKNEEEENKLREERRQHEQKLLKMITRSKEDAAKQKLEELKTTQELKALLEKQAAENSARLKREADEVAKKKIEKEIAEKKKREEEIANERRSKEEKLAKKMQDEADLLKRKQEEENKIKAEKLKYEEEMKKMILKFKEETQKRKEQEWIQAQEQKALLEKKAAEEQARKKREEEEFAKRKQEEKATEKKKREEETLFERKRKEQKEAEKKLEVAVILKNKQEEDKEIKEEKLKYEQVMKKMILEFKEETKKKKEQELIQAQEQKALLEKLAAVEEAKKKRVAEEADKIKREIEISEKKKRDEKAASEKKRKEQEETKIKQQEDNLLKKKQEEENRIKEEERQLERKIQMMAAQLKEETKKKNEEELKLTQEKALLLNRQAEVVEKIKREAEEEEKKNRKEEEAEKKKQTIEIKEKQRLVIEEAARVQREIIKADKDKQAKAEAEKQKQRELDQEIRHIIAKQKQEKEEQKKREQDLENAAKIMMLKQLAAVELAKMKLEKQNAAAEKVRELIHVEDTLEHTYDAVPTTVPKPVIQDIVIGVNISQYKAPLPPDPFLQEPADAIIPMMFRKTAYLLEASLEHNLKQVEEVDKKIADEGGVIRYALSDRSFIDKGWTVLPIEKVVRKMNVYRMRPAQPEFNWFEHNKKKRVLTYETGERLAEFDERGQCHWYYRNGRLALDYYEAEELNAQQRFVVYSNGEPDERGRARPFTVLATFDFLGSGVVFDHGGKIRLTYNQTEGVVLDRHIGPASTWKWHSLNDPPVLQQVMIDTKMAHKDPNILSLGDKKPAKQQDRNDAQMVAIEFENFVKDKKKKLSQKFKPFQIKMKALKINENFSLKILDQATIYLIFREGSANIKLNIGMLLDHKEIIDTDTADLGVVNNTVKRFPAATDSIAELQRSVEHAQRFERNRTERERILHPLPPGDSADRLVAGLSKPPKPTPKTILLSEAGSKSNVEDCKCSRKPSSNLYYNSRLA